MKDIKSHIFSLLSGSAPIVSAVGADGIHAFSDDSDTMEGFSDRFPQITYARLSATTDRIGKRVETFQISSWAKTMREAEDLNTAVVELFNRTMTQVYKDALVIHVADSFDPDTKTKGVHATVRFVLADASY